MTGLGLKLEELLKQKGLEKIKEAHSFDKLVEIAKLSFPISEKMSSKNNPIDTKKEIAEIANTSYDTVAKVKEIKKDMRLQDAF